MGRDEVQGCWAKSTRLEGRVWGEVGGEEASGFQDPLVSNSLNKESERIIVTER